MARESIRSIGYQQSHTANRVTEGGVPRYDTFTVCRDERTGETSVKAQTSPRPPEYEKENIRQSQFYEECDRPGQSNMTGPTGHNRFSARDRPGQSNMTGPTGHNRFQEQVTLPSGVTMDDFMKFMSTSSRRGENEYTRGATSADYEDAYDDSARKRQTPSPEKKKKHQFSDDSSDDEIERLLARKKKKMNSKETAKLVVKEIDYKRRGSMMPKMGTFDGVSATIESFIQKFENYSSYCGWNEVDRLFQLRQSLEKYVMTVLVDGTKIETYDDLMLLLLSSPINSYMTAD